MAFKKLTPAIVIALAVTGIVLAVLTSGLLTINQQVPATGTITSINLGVYSDSGCTTALTAVNFVEQEVETKEHTL
jgi:hypothetical protein